MSERAYVCRLTEREAQARRETIVRALFTRARRVERRADGLRVELPGDDDALEQACAFVASERRCCPFLTFHVRAAPDAAAIELRIEGPEETVPMLHAELGLAERAEDG